MDDREVHLTPTEYQLLVALVRHAAKVLTHRQLLKDVWGAHTVTQTPAQPRHLLTEPGVGYRLRAD